MAGAAGYGVSSPSYGYYRPPQVSRVGAGNRSLALAAGGGAPPPNDPFGLMTARQVGRVVPRQTPPAAAPAKTAAASTPYDVPIAPNGGLAGTPGYTAPASAATTPVVPPYDVNLDPSVAAITSLTGRSDSDAQAAALKQKQDLLLQYGDKNLISSILGDHTLAEAAGANPSSTLAQLGQQRDRNTTALTEGLNKANLLYSGYRVNQEQQAGQDYQNQLAQAAANVGGGLGTIDQNLSSALSQSQAQRIQAIIAAGQAHKTDPGAAPDSGLGGGSGGTGTGAGTVPPSDGTQPSGAGYGGLQVAPYEEDPALALALAASKRRMVAN